MSIRFTLFEKPEKDGPLSKIIQLKDGVPLSDASVCWMATGTATPVELSGLAAFADMLVALTPQQAISLGTLSNGNGTVPVVVERRLAVARRSAPQTIARTLDHLHFVEQQPGLLLCDCDRKGMPPQVAERIESHGGFFPALDSIAPGLANTGHVLRGSTSSGLSANGESYPSSGGLHAYIQVKDAADIPRATKVLHKRAVLAGFGWLRFSEGEKNNYQILERSLVDRSVGSPERLVFEGAPYLRPPLVQDAEARRPVVVEGDAIDTRAVLPDLSFSELRAYETAAANMRQPMAEATRRRGKADHAEAVKIAKRTQQPIEHVLRQVESRHGGLLAPELELEFDDPDVGVKRVADVLADPDTFIDDTLADPLEGSAYGRCKAKILRGRYGDIIIHSFAHGGALYVLAHDETTLARLLERTDRLHLVEVFAEAILSSVIDFASRERLRQDVAKRADVGLKVVNNAMKAAERRREEAKRQKQAAERVALDPRAMLPAPAFDAPRQETAAIIDRILSQVIALEPPMRDTFGNLVKVQERSIPELHELQDEEEADEEPIPAPPEPLITIRDADEVSALVEKHVRLMAKSRDGDEREVALDPAFSRGLMKLEAPTLMPVVTGVATMPLVHLDVAGHASLHTPEGLDRDTGVILRLPQSLRDILPDPDECTLERGEEAYRFLTAEWLADVRTDRFGKACTVTAAMSVLQRFRYMDGPGFVINSGQRGAGKTTLANMLSTAVSGRRAAASPWSTSEEERRKLLFALALEGIAMLVFDNMPRGTLISCPVIERVLTSGLVRDRVLGVSKTGEAPFNGVMFWTGNRIAPKGDMASRTLKIDITANRPDPENRSFRHISPISWTLAHRGRILRALYTLLLMPRPKVVAKTRFKEWWRLIAQPIEMVAGIDFSALMLRNDEFDEEAHGTVALLAELHKRFGDNLFTAAEVATLLDPEHGAPQRSYSSYLFSKEEQAQRERLKEQAAALRGSIEEASGGKAFPPGLPTSPRVGRKLQVIEDRAVDVDGLGVVCLRSRMDRATHTKRWSVRLIEGDAGHAAKESNGYPTLEEVQSALQELLDRGGPQRFLTIQWLHRHDLADVDALRNEYLAEAWAHVQSLR